jgi:hypothetical protein
MQGREMNQEPTRPEDGDRPDGDLAASDVARLDGAQMKELLERIPGARERIEAGIEDARHGRTLLLDDR